LLARELSLLLVTDEKNIYLVPFYFRRIGSPLKEQDDLSSLAIFSPCSVSRQLDCLGTADSPVDFSLPEQRRGNPHGGVQELLLTVYPGHPVDG